MLDIKGHDSLSKYKKNKQISIKETNTLDNKHRQMVKYFNNNKYEKEKLFEQINNINTEIKTIDDKRSNFNITNNDIGTSNINHNDIKKRASLVHEKNILESKYNEINIDEMDYYDNAGDLISDYYEMRDKIEPVVKETKNILEFL